MRGGEDEIRELGRALAPLAGDEPEPEGLPENGRVWRAARGELPPEEAAELVDRAAECGHTAEAWRLAIEIERARSVEAAATVVPMRRRRRWYWAAGLAAAAALAVVATAPLLRRAGPPARVERGGRAPVRSLLAEGQQLPRDRFELRFSPGPEGATYTVEVVTEDLEQVAHAAGLESPRFLVPEEALADLPDGAVVLWRVEVTTSAGTTTSPAFTQRVGPPGRGP